MANILCVFKYKNRRNIVNIEYISNLTKLVLYFNGRGGGGGGGGETVVDLKV